MNQHTNSVKIAVVIPCYKVRNQILSVLKKIPPQVDQVYCVDDGCPENTGEYIKQQCNDDRVEIISHLQNQGVGAAMISGYKAAIKSSADIIVKLDGDGQMDPMLISRFVKPIVDGIADYTKGNRFYQLENLSGMPISRLFGNGLLSFLSKFSTGYWHIFDPNNGYTAIHAKVLQLIPLDKINYGYFFESDMLFRLNIIRGVVQDIPMKSVYAEETSNIVVRKEIIIFSKLHIVNFCKRIFYNYYLRDFSIASLEWVIGPVALIFGIVFGISQWMESIDTGIEATAGTVMLAALPTIIGLQLLLSALNFDIFNRPTIPIQSTISD